MWTFPFGITQKTIELPDRNKRTKKNHNLSTFAVDSRCGSTNTNCQIIPLSPPLHIYCLLYIGKREKKLPNLDTFPCNEKETRGIAWGEDKQPSFLRREKLGREEKGSGKGEERKRESRTRIRKSLIFCNIFRYFFGSVA